MLGSMFRVRVDINWGWLRAPLNMAIDMYIYIFKYLCIAQKNLNVEAALCPQNLEQGIET